MSTSELRGRLACCCAHLHHRLGVGGVSRLRGGDRALSSSVILISNVGMSRPSDFGDGAVPPLSAALMKASPRHMPIRGPCRQRVDLRLVLHAEQQALLRALDDGRHLALLAQDRVRPPAGCRRAASSALAAVVPGLDHPHRRRTRGRARRQDVRRSQSEHGEHGCAGLGWRGGPSAIRSRRADSRRFTMVQLSALALHSTADRDGAERGDARGGAQEV